MFHSFDAINVKRIEIQTKSRDTFDFKNLTPELWWTMTGIIVLLLVIWITTRPGFSPKVRSLSPDMRCQPELPRTK